jgi:hypothetical protein
LRTSAGAARASAPATAEGRIHRIKTDNTPEAVALQKHVDWYGVLTDYRNAFVRCGIPERFGYVPPTEPPRLRPVTHVQRHAGAGPRLRGEAEPARLVDLQRRPKARGGRS